MIGLLIIAHGNLGESLIACANHIMNKQTPQLASLQVNMSDDPSDLFPQAQKLVDSLDTGEGVLVLSDMYGATPCNLVIKLLASKNVQGVAGVNLPMLVRVLTYRNESLKKIVEKAISGGRDGVVHFTNVSCNHNK